MPTVSANYAQPLSRPVTTPHDIPAFTTAVHKVQPGIVAPPLSYSTSTEVYRVAQAVPRGGLKKRLRSSTTRSAEVQRPKALRPADSPVPAVRRRIHQPTHVISSTDDSSPETTLRSTGPADQQNSLSKHHVSTFGTPTSGTQDHLVQRVHQRRGGRHPPPFRSRSSLSW